MADIEDVGLDDFEDEYEFGEGKVSSPKIVFYRKKYFRIGSRNRKGRGN